jgi:regulator of PEP synthase PpsR (kinase-PPPase family)
MEEIVNTMQHSIQNIELFHQDSVETLTTLIEENSKLPAKKESNSSSNNDSRFFRSIFTMNTHGNDDCSFPIDNSHKK